MMSDGRGNFSPELSDQVAEELRGHGYQVATIEQDRPPTSTVDLMLRILANTLDELDRHNARTPLDRQTIGDVIPTRYADVVRVGGGWCVQYYDEESARRARECHNVNCGLVNPDAIHVDH